MRTEVVSADGWVITVRGRTRRTWALANEYHLNLKDAHPDMKGLEIAAESSVSQIAAKSPRGWSLVGVASQFRDVAARISRVEFPDGTTADEPFEPSILVAMFDNYLDAETLPDGSDLWSQVESAIARLDAPPQVLDPNAERSMEKK